MRDKIAAAKSRMSIAERKLRSGLTRMLHSERTLRGNLCLRLPLDGNARSPPSPYWDRRIEFETVLVFGKKAVEAARKTGLAKGILRRIEDAPPYVEGRSFRSRCGRRRTSRF